MGACCPDRERPSRRPRLLKTPHSATIDPSPLYVESTPRRPIPTLLRELNDCDILVRDLRIHIYKTKRTQKSVIVLCQVACDRVIVSQIKRINECIHSVKRLPTPDEGRGVVPTRSSI